MAAAATEGNAMRYVIRPAVPEDRDAISAVCLGTAASGKDATPLYGDPRLPGLVWALPYAELEPAFAFVLVGKEGPVGYTLGTPDTRAFQARLAASWWPRVRRETAEVVPRSPADAHALSRIAEPLLAPDWLLADYPAHFHLNILPEAQRVGWGKRLTDVQIDALSRSGTRGVHFGISTANERAITFYRRMGFTEIGRGQAVYFGMRF